MCTWCKYEDEGGIALGVIIATLHVEGRGFDEQGGEFLRDKLLDTRYLVDASNTREEVTEEEMRLEEKTLKKRRDLTEEQDAQRRAWKKEKEILQHRLY